MSQLKSFIERILDLKKEQDEIGSDVRDVYAEAARQGIDKTCLGMAVRDEKQKHLGYQIYFAAFRRSGLLKIGISRSLHRRLTTLSAIRGERAGLLFSFSGTFPEEGWCHAQFSEWRLFGEWFSLNETTERMVSELALKKSVDSVSFIRAAS